MCQHVAEGIAARWLGGIRLVQGGGDCAQQRQAFGWQLRRPGFDGGDPLGAQQLHQQAGARRIQRPEPAQLDLAALVDSRPEPLHLSAQCRVMGEGPVTDDARPQRRSPLIEGHRTGRRGQGGAHLLQTGAYVGRWSPD